MRKLAGAVGALLILAVGVFIGLWWCQGSSPLDIELYPTHLEVCVEIPGETQGIRPKLCAPIPLLWPSRPERPPQPMRQQPPDVQELHPETQPQWGEQCNVPGVDKPLVNITNSNPEPMKITFTGATIQPPLIIHGGQKVERWEFEPGVYQYTVEYYTIPDNIPYIGAVAFQRTCTYGIKFWCCVPVP